MKICDSKPIDGEAYIIHGSDFMGDWSMVVKCVHYSDKNPKSLSSTQRKYGYKWVSEFGAIVNHCEVERFQKQDSK